MAFDRSDRVLADHATSAVIVARDPVALSHRIAGMPALSRQLIELARAGFGDAVVVAMADVGLAGRIRADLQRAGLVLQVRFDAVLGQARSLRGALVLDGAIVKATTLEALTRADDPIQALRLDTRLVARRLNGEDREEMESPDFWAGAGLPDAAIATAAPGEAIALDSPAMAERMVLRDTGKASDGLVSRHLNRPISRLLSGCLLRWDGMRPGHATVLTALTATAMFVSLAHGTPLGLALGCLLFHAASIVDGLDGEIARATYRTSAKGAALDTAVDMTSNLMFAIGLTIGLTRHYGDAYLQIGVFCSVGLLIGIVSMTLLARRSPGGGSFDILKSAYGARAAEGAGIGVVTAVRTATSRDFFAFVFAVMGLLGMARFIPWILAFGVGLWLLIIAGGASIIFSSDETDPVRR
jgi:phosphatidylglycerophosphate synthase